MFRSFDAVLNSSINNSKTKQAHGFPKEQRFKSPHSPICNRDSYNLTNLDMVAQIQNKRNSTSLSPRFRYKNSFTPSPSDYKKKSFIEESILTRRGPKILTHDRMKQNRLSTSPGPGQYTPIVKPSTPQITMSPRYSRKTNKQQFVSPSYYKTDLIDAIGTKKSNMVSKYNNVSFYRIGQQKRFRDKNEHELQPGPGSYNHNHSFDLGTSKKTYSFGSAKKGLKNAASYSPGPGAYDNFSQFAERKARLQSKLHKLSELVGYK